MKLHEPLLHLLLAILALSTASCGAFQHTHQFDPDPTIGALSAHKLDEKCIAFDFSATPETLHQSANGHTFTVTGIRWHAEQVMRKLFANDRVAENLDEADVILALDLDLDLSAAFLGTKATCVATWTIRDDQGELLAQAAAEEVSDYPVMANGGRNCELAALQAMAVSLDSAMAKL